MAAAGDWTVFLGKGLGKLKFGMSPAQVLDERFLHCKEHLSLVVRVARRVGPFLS